MKLLLDTHVLVWLAQDTKAFCLSHVPPSRILKIRSCSVSFLLGSGREKNLNRPDFQVDADVLRTELLANRFEELPLLAEHVLAVNGLPVLHRDPFDRLLICQALTENCSLMTDENKILQYPDLSVFRV